MAKFSLTQAAKEVGKSKPTISKAIKTGRLSAHKVGNGYEIDAAELFRVYPKVSPTIDGEVTTDATRVSLLELETKMLRQQIEREQETVADLRARLDKADARITDARPTPRKWFWQK